MTRIYLSRYWFTCAAVLLACSSIEAAASPFTWEPTTHQILQADFNHDGYPDLLFQARTAAAKHYLVLGQNPAAQRYDYTNPIELPQKINQVHWHQQKFQLLALTTPAQDGAALLAIAKNGSTAWLFAQINSAVDLSTPTQNYEPKQHKWLSASSSTHYYTGDFNGDGHADLLQLDSEKGEHQVILAEKQHRFSIAKKLSKTVQWGLKNNERLIIRDFNKDGQDDIFAQSAEGQQPHVLLYSEGKGRFASDDGKLIPVQQAALSWADNASGITAVRRKSDQQTVLFRAFNHAERNLQNKRCAGWLFDTETMITQEYCPVVTSGNAASPLQQPDSAGLQGCPGDMIVADEVTTLQTCPGSLIPDTPTAAPRVSFNQAAQGVQFNVVLASTSDYNALTYQLSAQSPSGNTVHLGTVAAPTTLSPPKPSASLKVSINTAGHYQLMYRSCNYNGCSGFGPSSTISITSPIVSHKVTTTTTEGGSLAPTSADVNHGETTVFNIKTAAGYELTSVKGCQGKLSGSTYTTGSIFADCEVAAVFKRLSYVVHSSTDGGGTIAPTPTLTALYGETRTFSVTPGAGKEVLDIKGCNGKRNGNSYTTGPITSVCHVQATFTAKTFTVTATAEANGTINPPKKSVNAGNTTTFTVTPFTGYIASANGCDGRLIGTTYTTGVITADCDVRATFSQQSYTVSTTAGTNGSISAGKTVNHGQTTTFTVIPNTGYTATASGCDGRLSGTTYTTGPITSACHVGAIFTAQQPSAQTIYLHTDVLGSVILETDASGNVKKRTEYKPFGESKDN